MSRRPHPDIARVLRRAAIGCVPLALASGAVAALAPDLVPSARRRVEAWKAGRPAY